MTRLHIHAQAAGPRTRASAADRAELEDIAYVHAEG
jgi:hypothetical protein